MKFLLFSGSHSRHVYVHQELIESDAIQVEGIVSMERESMLPKPPDGLSQHDEGLFTHHFQLRHQVEQDAYGDLSSDRYESVAPTMYVEPEELNSERVAAFVRDVDPDASFIFGTNLILDPVYSELPEWRLNFHLGLSPWYKGAATLFWPFYFLEPQFAGGTLHQIVAEPDAGEIVHQTTPVLERGRGIHETASDVVVAFADDTVRLLEYLAENGSLPRETQNTTGKLFLARDFSVPHLRVIYDLFDNDIVDEYLDGNLSDREPTLVDALEKLDLEGPADDGH